MSRLYIVFFHAQTVTKTKPQGVSQSINVCNSMTNEKVFYSFKDTGMKRNRSNRIKPKPGINNSSTSTIDAKTIINAIPNNRKD